MKKRTLLGLSALVVAVSSLVTALSAGAVQYYTPFFDGLSSYNTTLWRKADWSSPGLCQNTVQNVTHDGDVMKLELNDTPAGGYDYSCAEYETKEKYGYGTYSASIKAAAQESGVVTGFFVYYGERQDKTDHDEIDFEILGIDPTKVQTNYFVDGIGGHERTHDLGFDASRDYHTYAFKWESGQITWSVDGIELRSIAIPIALAPGSPGKIKANLWTPDPNVWPDPGPFSYPGNPIHSRFHWINFTPLVRPPDEPTPYDPGHSEPGP